MTDYIKTKDMSIGQKYELFGLTFICGEERVIFKDGKWRVEKIDNEEIIDIEEMVLAAMKRKFNKERE